MPKPASKSSVKSDSELLKHQLQLLDERLLEVVSIRAKIAPELGNDKKLIEEIVKNAQKKAKELGVDQKLASELIALVSKTKNK